MEQHVKEMRQIRQYHGTRLQVVYLTYIYLRDQIYKGEDKMNKDLHFELETQGNLLETMRAEMETFKGGNATTGGGKHSFKIFCLLCGMPGLHKGGNKFCQWKDLYQAEAREKGLKFATDAVHALYRVGN
jgi:hypothetical protein